jgi:hypothetical protein
MKIIAKLPILTLFISLIYSSSLLAQDVNEKIKNIDGEVNKITITTEEGEYTFDGEDAAKLFKKMKSSANSFVWHSAEKEGKRKIVFLDSDDEEHHVEIFSGDDEDVIIISEDENECMNEMHKKVKVEIEDGNKKVTVTTNENGVEKTEVYEGDDADKYIKEMKKKHGSDMDIYNEKNTDDGKVKKKKIIIEKKTDKKSE